MTPARISEAGGLVHIDGSRVARVARFGRLGEPNRTRGGEIDLSISG